MNATPAAESPAALARHFQRSCGAAPMVVTPHSIAVIASEARRLMYLTNVKAGSTSMRTFLRGIGSDWITGPDWKSGVCTNASEKLFVPGAAPACLQCVGICPCPRTTTACYAEARLAGLLRFSFVRDPVTKFESGAEQMRFADKAYENTSTDAILELQLRMHAGAAPASWPWLNEHLQPSSWRLSGSDAHGNPLWPQFVGKVEQLGPAAFGPATANESSQPGHWLALLQRLDLRPSSRLSDRPPLANHRQRPKHAFYALSEQAVRRLCDAPAYSHEWHCFRYSPPAVCLAEPSLRCCHVHS